MPILDLSHSTKDIQLLNITAIMCFPSENMEGNRRYWSLKQWVAIAAEQYIKIAEKEGSSEELSKHVGSWFGEIIYHVGSWPALGNAIFGPGHRKSPPTKEARTYLGRGLIVGSILKNVLILGAGHSTANQGFCTDDNDRIFKKLGVKPPSMDYNHIQNKLWPHYKDAAHLWAAFFDAGSKHIFPKNLNWSFPLDQWRNDALHPSEPQGLKGFIKLSNFYRNEAINYIPTKGPRTPLLDKETTWEIII